MDNTANTVPPDFDPAAYEEIDTADVRIKTPTGIATAMVITLAGVEHPSRKRIVMGRQRKLRAAIARNPGKLPMSDPEDDELDSVELLTACTLSWTGSVVPYTPAAARALYSDPKRRWLRDQVQAALDDRELFTRSSAAA